MWKAAIICVAILLGLTIVGCGFEEDCQVKASDGKKYDCDDNAELKCENLIQTYCNRYAECSALTSESSCLSQASSALSCSSAVAITNSYDDCISDIQNYSCNQITNDIPYSCKGTILAE
jgi:hypothetical protein